MARTLEVVVGAQFGSEAKGHVVQRLTERAQQRGICPLVIRVAGPNAGHTGYDADGQAWALRQVPVAVVTPGPAILYIAPGSEIDLPVLLDEIDRLTSAGLMKGKYLYVSAETTMITDEHKHLESVGNLVGKIGSTGKGIGAARADRIWRHAKRLIDDRRAMDELQARHVKVMPHFARFDEWLHVIIEGTQGYGLGLHAGYYPKCTSSDCRAIDFMAMAAINPWEFDVSVWAVARIFPIRVAGNSGPLRNETTWEALGLPEEHTTVTKKVRRVGMPDWRLVREAVMANGGPPVVRLALTMLDQKFRTARDLPVDLEDEILMKYIAHVEFDTGAKVELVTTGPNTATFLS